MADNTIRLDAHVLENYLLFNVNRAKNGRAPCTTTLELDGKIVRCKVDSEGVHLTLTKHTRKTWSGSIEHWNDFGEDSESLKRHRERNAWVYEEQAE